MTLHHTLTAYIQKAVQELFDIAIDTFEFQATRKDFEGDITVVVFPLVKMVKGNPVEIGTQIGNYLVNNAAEVAEFNVVGGFLNLVISDAYYVTFFNSIKVLCSSPAATACLVGNQKSHRCSPKKINNKEPNIPIEREYHLLAVSFDTAYCTGRAFLFSCVSTQAW